MSEFISFVERPEKVEAFQFNGPAQVEQVLDAFGVSHSKWTLQRNGTTYRPSFPLNDKPQTIQSVAPLSPVTISLINGIHTYPDEANCTIVSGSWVVKRYIDTDHPEVTVTQNKEFRRKYQASIEAG